MTYTRTGPFANNSGPYLDAGFLNKVEDGLAAANAVLAPAPSGGDDTAVLQGLLNTAATTGGTLVLQAGTYLANLQTPQSFSQPWIIGRGQRYTTIQAFDGTKPVVKFRGGSGGLNGGGIRDLGLKPATSSIPTGTAVAFSGCTGVKAVGVAILDGFAVGVKFWNELGADFTEFCTFEGDIANADTPVLYQVDNGVESFHGSGLVGTTTINVLPSKSGPIIKTVGKALPYNAPLSFTVWFTGAGQYLIDYGQTQNARHASFFGTIRIEGTPPDANSAMGRASGSVSSAFVYLIGGISWLSATDAVLGNIVLATKVAYSGGTVWAETLPMTSRTDLKNTATIVATNFEGGASYLVDVSCIGPNYHKSFLLFVQQDAYNSANGVILSLGRMQNVDNSGLGDPTFTFSTGALYANNAGWTSTQGTFKANTTKTYLGGSPNQFIAQARHL